MISLFSRWLVQHTHRAVALLIAPGLLALAFDSGVAHYVGKDGSHPGQGVPVAFGIAAAAAIAIAVFALKRPTFGWTLRAVGALSVLVGGAGTVFHGLALWEDLAGGGFTASALEDALFAAPPLLAPAAFAGIGALLWVLVSPHLRLGVVLGRREARARAAETGVGTAPQES